MGVHGSVETVHLTLALMTLTHRIFLQRLPGDPSGFKEATRRHAAGLKFALAQVAEHRKNIDTENPKDYIESYLVEMNRRAADPCTQFTG